MSLLSSGQTHASLNEVQVYLFTNLHAVLELVLVIGLGALGLDVLLDGVDLRLILDQLLLDVVQPVVDLVTKDLILLRIVLNGVQTNLLVQVDLVDLDKLSDSVQARLLALEVRLQLVGLRELVVHVVFHVRALLLGVLHLLVDTRLE